MNHILFIYFSTLNRNKSSYSKAGCKKLVCRKCCDSDYYTGSCRRLFCFNLY